MKELLKLVIFVGLVVIVLFAIRGCVRSADADFAQKREAEKENRWKEPERKVTVIITVNKYNRQECIEADGTFVIGDTKEFGNALVGCIEKEKP